MNLKSGINEVWPTIVLKGEIDQATLEKVCNSLLINSDIKNPPGDFQSFDILHDGCEDIKEFKETVVIPAFEEYLNRMNLSLKNFPSNRLRSWITGTKNGYMIPIHNHSGSSFSAVFYLLCEEQNKGGELVMLDPRGNANRGYLDEFKPMFENLVYKPVSGEYVIFPSYLYHHTNVFNGTLRLAMPVDLFL